MKTFAGSVTRALIILSLMLFPVVTIADIRSDVDRETIGMGESLRLTITGDAKERLDQLDLAALQFDWEILSSSSSTNTSFINGARSTTRTLSLDLLPLRDGILSIPSLSTGGNRTTPIAITVNPQTVSAGGDDSVRFSIEIDKRDIYIQEQMILTVTIEQAINLDGAEVTQLELSGAIVEELTRRNFQRQINGRLWRVTQLRYAIYPQQRGALEIPSLSLTAREVLPGRSLLGARLGKRFRLSEDAIAINVKPVPEDFPGDVWLPATSLELAQSWSTPPESMEIGDSTTRTLTLAAEGLLSSQLPSITSMSDSSKITGIRVYPDQESSDQIERTEGFLGQRTRSEALVASGSGSWTLPEVRVPWWNTETDSLQFAILPSTTISVGSPVVNSPVQPITNTAEMQTIATPVWLNGLAGLGWLLALLFAYKLWRSRDRKTSDVVIDTTEETLRPLLTAMKASTSQNDAPATRQLLLRWATLHYQQPVRTLDQLKRFCGVALADQLTTLETAIYSQNDEAWTSGAALYRAVRDEAKLVSTEQTDYRSLYPTV
ncbi:MAG: BatD family protein [Pseudomonadota bacterium]|nr:BatD family protein [Pseudomonadota bacterium]